MKKRTPRIQWHTILSDENEKTILECIKRLEKNPDYPNMHLKTDDDKLLSFDELINKVFYKTIIKVSNLITKDFDNFTQVAVKGE